MKTDRLALVADDEARALAVLGEIVHVQREYMREGDPQRMWDELLQSLLRTTSSAAGFIGEVEWDRRGIPSLTTRAMVRNGLWGSQATPHPDVGLLVSQVIAEQAPVVIDLVSGPDAAGSSGPIGAFLGMPLISSDRMVGLVGLTSPSASYRPEWVEQLQPLLSACASIVESLQAARERSRLVAELEQTAGFLQAVINATTHGILVVGPEGQIESANPAAHALLGSPPGALLGRPVLDFAAPGDLRAHRTLLRRSLTHGIAPDSPPFISTVVSFSGVSRPVDVSVGQMQLDGQTRLVLMLNDITERLQAQAALARAAEILDATPDLVAWADPECRLVYVNRGGRAMLGLDQDAAVEGMTIQELCSDEAEGLDIAIAAAQSSGVWRGEVKFRAATGGSVPVSLVVIADEAYVAVLARDLTERFEIDRLKEAFVANVSHELRTPLTAVIGYLELLREGVLGEVSPDQAEALEVMTRNGDRLLDLIGDILLIGSLDAGGVPTSSPVDLADLVGDVAADLASLAERKSIHVTVSRDESAVVSGEENELRTVVSNLMGNALKFTPEEGRVGVEVTTSDEEVVLTVSDDGCGIDSDELEHVFSRFFRGDFARRSEIQGTGLGLAIVQGVVQRHGGTVDITSKVGVGTSVTVTLPSRKKGTK